MNIRITSIDFFDEKGCLLKTYSKRFIFERCFSSEYELENFLIDILTFEFLIFKVVCITNFSTQFTITKSFLNED